MAADTKERTQIKVEAYAGYRAGETPRRVILNGRALEVEMIVYRHRVVHLDNYEEEEHFRIVLKGYGVVDIVYKPRIDRWELKKDFAPEQKFSEML